MYTNHSIVLSHYFSFILLKKLGVLAELALATKTLCNETMVYQTKGGYYVRVVALPNGIFKKYYYQQMDERSGELQDFLFSRNIDNLHFISERNVVTIKTQ